MDEFNQLAMAVEIAQLKQTVRWLVSLAVGGLLGALILLAGLVGYAVASYRWETRSLTWRNRRNTARHLRNIRLFRERRREGG